MFANYLSYKDKSFATYDAMLVGSAHCTTDSWDRASVNFLLSGGFLVSDNVKRVKQVIIITFSGVVKSISVFFYQYSLLYRMS